MCEGIFYVGDKLVCMECAYEAQGDGDAYRAYMEKLNAELEEINSTIGQHKTIERKQ